MIRPWHTWVIFGLCLAVVLAAMGWISLTALELDRKGAEANQLAATESNIRLALWRMDSALAPLIAQEAARTYFVYTAFYPAQRAYNRMFAEIQRGEVLFPSPLLDQASEYVLVHFQIGPDGVFTSPQVPTGNMRDLAEAVYTTYEKIETSAERLARLQSLLSRDRLLAALPVPQTQPTRLAALPVPQTQPVQLAALPVPQTQPVQLAAGPQRGEQIMNQGQQPDAQQGPGPPPPQKFDFAQRTIRQTDQIDFQQRNRPQPNPQQQELLNVNEWQARASNIDSNTVVITNDISKVSLTGSNVTEGLARPLWIGDVLLLARAVSVNGELYLQGCQLGWPAIEAWLVGTVKDLLPDAKLQPVATSAGDRDEGRMLAALPAKLLPGGMPQDAHRPLSPIRISLVVAWICILLAAVAVVVLLVGTVSLSERRAAFVSAVTHEMRTPLTTFRMYTEMLVKGMIPDEAKRRRYLDTLRLEADRLNHLVANVLAYARLERNRTAGEVESVTLGELIGRMKERFTERARQASMSLVAEAEESALNTNMRVNTSAVEQSLFNLVDNACKYAASASDRRIHLEADRDGKFAILRVRDHGPGISGTANRRLFRPFGKSVEEAANSAPGVGLGLALSRRLARSMGGDLRIDQSAVGACLVLTLPTGD